MTSDAADRFLQSLLQGLREDAKGIRDELHQSVDGLRGDLQRVSQQLSEGQEKAARERRKLFYELDQAEARRRQHMAHHGLDPEDLGEPAGAWDGSRYSSWVATERTMLWRHRWRLAALAFVLLGVCLPDAWPYLRGLIGVLR